MNIPLLEKLFALFSIPFQINSDKLTLKSDREIEKK